MLLSLSSGFLMAQHSVVGKIVDDAGEVVISASVIVEGTNRGVLSDLDGSYKINAPSSTASLTVSYLGYKTQVIPIENRTENQKARFRAGVGLFQNLTARFPLHRIESQCGKRQVARWGSP